MNELVTKREASEIIGVSPSTFDRIRRRGDITHALTIKRKPLLFQKRALLEFCNRHDSPGLAPMAALRATRKAHR